MRVHYGYRRVHVLLRREGWKDNHKRVYRLYRAEGLSLRHRRPKRNKAARLRQPKQLVSAMNEIWSMDFVSDALYDGRRLRALTVVDNYTRECLATEVGQSLKGVDVVKVLNRLKSGRNLPATINFTVSLIIASPTATGATFEPLHWTGWRDLNSPVVAGSSPLRRTQRSRKFPIRRTTVYTKWNRQRLWRLWQEEELVTQTTFSRRQEQLAALISIMQ